MSFASNLLTAFTRVGTEFKTVYGKLGDLTTLTTTSKSSLVGAINEVKASVSGAGAVIDDTTASGSTVYSSTKTNAAVSAAITALINGAPGALDTLKEITDQLASDESAASALTTAVGNRVRYDAAQTLSSGQMAQANTNMGSLSLAQSGDPTTDFAAAFVAALA